MVSKILLASVALALVAVMFAPVVVADDSELEFLLHDDQASSLDMELDTESHAESESTLYTTMLTQVEGPSCDHLTAGLCTCHDDPKNKLASSMHCAAGFEVAGQKFTAGVDVAFDLCSATPVKLTANAMDKTVSLSLSANQKLGVPIPGANVGVAGAEITGAIAVTKLPTGDGKMTFTAAVEGCVGITPFSGCIGAPFLTLNFPFKCGNAAAPAAAAAVPGAPVPMAPSAASAPKSKLAVH